MAVANARRLFVDANIWIAWGQGFAKAEATTLTELINHGLVKLVSTDLTLMEIAKRFRNNDIAALDPLIKADLKHAARQYLQLEIPGFDRDKLRVQIFNHHLQKVKLAMFSQFQAEVRSIDNVKPSHVLEQYTHGTGLFGPSGKKDQFPDAFIFAAVSGDVSAEKPLIVWSQDGDFAIACEESGHITRVTSMPQLLDALGIKREDDAIQELFDSQPELFLTALQEELMGYSIDADDVPDANVELLEVLDVISINVTSVYRAGEGEGKYIGFGKCEVRAQVEFNHPDWDSAIYDSEDKVLIPLHSVEGETELDLGPYSFTFLADIVDGQVAQIHECDMKERWGLRGSLLQDRGYF
ncbi:PIN domain-containing protein [Stenotrophomonas sp. SAU14A_NAIMI4_8]|uniref:PIN domain-containing protein n=1 Tax=Stenotrophomonas sp. SAU14A_NAIMI4_8 TaxID=2072409 RepID=UPI000D541FC5|nr:PIN domain-containing protein [Stenotrophomonas sp. SAU14A_NAIMI4_8]AWH33946.1 hypothetical protein C1930_14300 [Stenotrophomonas sp. SAU14A_NAIMI4_8]